MLRQPPMIDIDPRVAAFMAAMHAAAGSRGLAAQWLVELIAWAALASRDQRQTWRAGPAGQAQAVC